MAWLGLDWPGPMRAWEGATDFCPLCSNFFINLKNKTKFCFI